MTPREFWTAEEDEALVGLYPTTDNLELVSMMNDRFGTHRSKSAIAQRARKLGAEKAEGHRHPMPRPFWPDEKRAWFREFVPGHTESEISAEHERLYGTPLTRGQIKSAKGSFGVKSGTFGGRFEKGQAPSNKGKTWDEFMPRESQERSRRTCFKKGNMPHNAKDKPIWHERIDCNGYTWVKIAERPSRQDCNDNWRPKQHLVWEEAHGMPVPANTNIVFANHDKRDFRPENLVAVPRRLWSVVVRNEMAYYDAASLQACMNIAELKSAIGAAKLSPRTCRQCGKDFEPRYAHQRTCDACLGRE